MLPLCWLVRDPGLRQPAPPRLVPRVTFSEHIAPILYDNCVTCHRPGEAAPFSLISYEDAAKRGTTAGGRDEVAVHAAVACRARLRRLCGRAPADGRANRQHRRMGEAGHAARQHRRCRSCRRSRTGGSSASRTSCSKCPRPSTFRRTDRTSTATSRFRPASPKTSGCARWSFVPARAAWSITRCFNLRVAARWQS